MLHIVAMISGGLLGALVGKILCCITELVLKFFKKIFEIGIDKEEKM